MKNMLLFTTVSALVLNMSCPAMSEESTPAIDLSEKPITTPTLDYLHEKDAKYPQSAYTITKVEDEDSPYSFELATKDETGEFVTERYLIGLNTLGSSQNIEWTLADKAGTDTVELKLPHETKYFKYTYHKPDEYTETNKRITTLTADNAQNVVFQNISGGSDGGAIYNTSSLPDVNIKADLIGNYVSSISNTTHGGAIYNVGINGSNATIGDITGDFIGNYGLSTSNGAFGGAIYNKGRYNSPATISNIIGNFIGNYAQGAVTEGGAIYNEYGTIGNITGNFIGNYASNASNRAKGGAIYNYNKSTIGDIIGDFIGNHAQGKNNALGGAILNYSSTIGDISGDFIGNYIKDESVSDLIKGGGAIYNYNKGTIGDIIGDFIGNYAQANYTHGGAISSGYESEIGNITGDFIGNYAKSESNYAQGGAIYNYDRSSIGDITGDFIGNYVQGSSSAIGGAIYNDRNASIGDISGDFIGNFAKAESSYAQGGALYNYRTIGNITGDFIGNYAKSESNYAQGGAIYNYDTITLTNSNFTGNYVSGNADSKGGAIYSTKDITIIADNGISEFTGNYALIKGTEATEDTSAIEDRKIPNAIYMYSKFLTLNLNAVTNGEILFNDEINGQGGYKIALGGDNTGTITFNNNIRNAAITLESTNLVLGNAGVFADNSSFIANSGTVTLTKLGLEDRMTAKALQFNNVGLTIKEADVNLETPQMGTIDGDVLSITGGSINVEKMLISKDGDEGETRVDFITGDNIPQADVTVGETLAPVYKYEVAYDAETGEFVFVRGDKIIPDPLPSIPATPIVPIRPAYKAFNPGVFANDVAAMSGLNMQGDVAKQVFDLDTNREYCFGRIWATPYYSDDTLGFSNFYDVDSKNYGLIAGVDTRAFGNPDGWNSVYTLFGAYNDGENKYQGVKVDSKSWLVGLKASIYNGGFYTDALMNYAWHDSDQTTAFGKDSVDSTGYGAAVKSGYKHGFENRVELDTSAMLSWQHVEGDNFTSKSGARIATDDYSRLTLIPQVKLGYSFEHVKPYALVRYNFVLDEDGNSTVNNIALPTIESKDYVEYGLGVETTDAFPHGGYAHVLRHDGGRTGWSVTAGYRFNF